MYMVQLGLKWVPCYN